MPPEWPHKRASFSQPSDATTAATATRETSIAFIRRFSIPRTKRKRINRWLLNWLELRPIPNRTRDFYPPPHIYTRKLFPYGAYCALKQFFKQSRHSPTCNAHNVLIIHPFNIWLARMLNGIMQECSIHYARMRNASFYFPRF